MRRPVYQSQSCVYPSPMMPDFHANFPPRKARTHEVCGPNALAFAFALGGQLGGTVLWVREAWQKGQLNPVGFEAYLPPHTLLLAQAKDQTDVLAVAEEALRSGAVSLVVMELSRPLGLTEGRRLQLAAQTGQATGLCVIPEGMGSNAAETRWHCAALFDPDDSTLQRWQIIKNKSGTICAWDVKWDAKARRVIVVSKTAQRQGSAGAPD